MKYKGVELLSSKDINAIRRRNHEFIMELSPEAQITNHNVVKGRFVWGCADSEPFMCIGSKAKVVRYIAPEGSK